MTALIASELLKLRTTRTFFGLTGSALGLVLLITVLAGALAPFEAGDQPFADLISISTLAGFFALVLGILAITVLLSLRTAHRQELERDRPEAPPQP